MRSIPAFAVLVLASSLLTPQARAQDSAARIISTPPPITRDEVGALHLAIGGIKGAAAGTGVGLPLGFVTGAIGCRATDRSWCILTYGLGGALAGLIVGTPVGVHLANRGSGNLALTTVGSIAATSALLALGSTLTRGNGPPIILTLPFEIGTAIPIERYIERRRERTNARQ